MIIGCRQISWYYQYLPPGVGDVYNTSGPALHAGDARAAKEVVWSVRFIMQLIV